MKHKTQQGKLKQLMQPTYLFKFTRGLLAPFFYMRRLKDGEEMPIDFWNYKVNPILGYYLPKEEGQSEAMERKYNIITKSI